MNTILYLECSPRGAASYSRLIAEEAVEKLQEKHPQARIVYRNLGGDPPPHVDALFTRAMFVPVAQRTPAEQQALAHSEALIAELEAADMVVIGTPMHNYSVPSPLKAWIDHIVRAHRTFLLTPTGKQGVLADRPVYVIVAAGGYFASDIARQPDFLTPYLSAVFSTIGIESVEFVTLEGLGRGGEVVQAALDAARQRIADTMLADSAVL
ncbi:MAG: NAD(P)H-dependent oxidoreductase [Pseudomonadota bacterium]